MLNVKLLILNCLSVVFLFGYEANCVTGDEMMQLKVIDKKIYDLSVREVNYNFEKIAFYIFRNLSYDLHHTRLKISSSANIRTNTTDTIRDDGTTSRDRNTASIGLNLTYPIFDRKEKNDRKKAIIEIKKKIISDVKNYFKLKAELDDLKIEKLILKQIEIRAKARKIDGVGGFNDWLKVLKDIKKTNFSISLKEIDLIEKEQILLNYISLAARTNLKAML